MQIRRAAATAREALLDQAASKLGVAKIELVVRDGRRHAAQSVERDCHTPNSSAIDNLTIKVDPAAPLKDPKDYTIVGKPVPRLDIPAKIFGTFNFVQDVKVPGMLHARMVHPAGVARASSKASNDDRVPQDHRLRARGTQRRLPGCRRDQRMGRHPRDDRDRRQRGPIGLGCRTSRSSSNTCATRRSTGTSCSRPTGTRPRR